MHLEATDRENQYKVWLTDQELEELRRHAGNARNDLIIQLGAYVGLRAFEIPQICPMHVTKTSGSEHHRLRVPEGKDISGNGGESRNAYLPKGVKRDLHRYKNAEGLAPPDHYIDLSTSGVRATVDRVAARTAVATDTPDYRHVTPHDLRRRYAQRLLVDEQMNPRVVMEVGGWDSFEAIRPYLNAPSEDVVDNAFANADLGV